MAELPTDTIDVAERLTRLARNAIDDDEASAYRRERDARLEDHGFAARIREDDDGTCLVCYPTDWLEDGTVRIDRIDELDRAVERPLDGPGPSSDFDQVEAHNRSVAADVENSAGPAHGANAHAFADFMGNHYVRPVESATASEIEEFLTEYFPRNAWPTDAERAVVDESLRLLFQSTETPVPPPIRVDDGAPTSPTE